MESQLAKDLLNSVTDYDVDVAIFVDSIEVQQLLDEARKTIDELREQNKIMRKIMEMIIAEHEEDHIDGAWSCAWCGAGLGDSFGDTVHEESCLVRSTKLLLTTIPEIK